MMTTFPVTASLLSTDALNIWAQQTYRLPSGTTCKILKAGINHTYHLHSPNTDVILRVYTQGWRTQPEIEAELALLNQLAAAGIAVSTPIPDDHGVRVQLLNAPEGERFAVLFTMAAGEKVPMFSPDLHEEAGRVLGCIHQITQNQSATRPTYTPDILSPDELPEIAAYLPAHTPEWSFLRHTQTIVQSILSDVAPKDLRHGLVHLDFWADNVHVSGSRITVFDFDFCGNGWLALDVAYYLLQAFRTTPDPADYAQIRHRFLSGYTSIAQLSDAESKILPTLGLALYHFYLSVQCRRFHDWSHAFLNEPYLRRYTKTFIQPFFEAHFDAFNPGS